MIPPIDSTTKISAAIRKIASPYQSGGSGGTARIF